MRGYGISFGAITVLNAIPCGIGSTIGIKLKTEAFYEESDKVSIELVDRELPDTLVRTCVERTLEKLNIDTGGYRLTVKSEIPPSVGLKSSSSVCNAVISAVLNAYNSDWSDLDIVELGVKCAKECNVTVTGAFDDACGCMFGGLIVANNTENKIILRKSVPKYDVVICIPEGTVTKDNVDVLGYRRHSDEFISLANSIKDDYLGVLTKNGKIVGRISGFNDVSDYALKNGAIAAGISGTGPATAIVVEYGKGKELAKGLHGRTIVTETRSCISFSNCVMEGSCTAPPSKSHTHRAIVMAALSDGKCTIRNPLQSKDIDSTIDALKHLGSKITKENNTLTVKTDSFRSVNDTIDVGNSGTTMRFVIGISSLLDHEITIDGDDSIRRRSNKGLIDALERCGVKCSSDNGKTPITIRGPIKCNEIIIDDNDSSQFLSSILIISPLIGNPVDVIVKGKRISKPYVDMTVSMMKQFGIDVSITNHGYHIEPGTYKRFDYNVPGDFSSAAYPLVAGGLSGTVAVKGLDLNDEQGDKKIVDILKRVGCTVTVDDYIICKTNGRPKAIDLDLSDIPDLFPIIAVLLSTANGKSRLFGAPHLRFKESDRISSTVKMLASIGADIIETNDGCIINGVDELRGGTIDHCGDHRVMMAAVIASLVSKRPVTMDDDGCWKISYPDFVDNMHSLGVKRCIQRETN